MRTERQHSLKPASIASPARKIETPCPAPQRRIDQWSAPPTFLMASSHRLIARPARPTHTNPPLKLNPVVRQPRRSLNRLPYHGQMVQPLFHQQSNNPIRVEDKVTPARLYVADNGEAGLELGSRGKADHVGG